MNMDTVVSGLQQKLQNLKAQGQKNESSTAATSRQQGEQQETGDFKMALRKFSKHGSNPVSNQMEKPSVKKSTKKNEDGIKIVNGKEEFTIEFEQEQKLKSK